MYRVPYLLWEIKELSIEVFKSISEFIVYHANGKKIELGAFKS